MNLPLIGLVRLFTVLVALFVVAPAIVIVVSAFNEPAFMSFPPKAYSPKWFYVALANPDFQRGFANSVWVMLWASTLAVIVGTAFSIAMRRSEFVGKNLLESFILSPLVVPHFTIGLGILMLFVNVHMVQGFAPVVLCHTILALPFVIRSVYISLHNLDLRLELAASSLGAKPRRVLTSITLPLLLPGIVGGWIFAAILSFNEFTGTVFVVSQSTRTLPVAMYNHVRESTDPAVAAVATLYIAVTMIVILLAFALLGPGKGLNRDKRS